MSAQNQQRTGPSRTVIAIGAVVVVILLIVAGALLVLRRVKPDVWPDLSPSAAPAPTSVVPVVKQDPLHWYFAEGVSVAPFQTFFAILNPGQDVAQVDLVLYPDSGPALRRTVRVAPGAQTTVPANSIAPEAMFGTAITSTHAVYIERFTVGVRDGASSTAMQPALNWFFPEAQAGGDLETRLVLFNPGDSVATVTVQPRPVNGSAAAQIFEVAAKKRRCVLISTLTLSGAMALEVRSTTPIVAEHVTQYDAAQAMYGGPGVPESGLSKTWYVTLANTETWYSARVAVFNPDDHPAKVTVMSVQDKTRLAIDSPADLRVQAHSKWDLNVNSVASGTRVAVEITADRPIAVQSVGAYASNRDGGAVAAFSALAAQAPAKLWYLPGATGDDVYNSYISVYNPSSSRANVTITYIVEESESYTPQAYLVRPLERMTVSARGQLSNASGRVAAVIVKSDRPVVVDRMTTFNRTVGATASGGIAGK